MKTVLIFLLWWAMSTMCFLSIKGADKTCRQVMRKCLLQGAITAIIAVVLLTLIVYLF